MTDSEKLPGNQAVVFGGSCACGRITYDSTHLTTKCTACHCVTCRKLSGGPFQAYLDTPSKSTTFYDNKEQLRYEGLPKDSIGGITYLRLSKAGERAYCLDCKTPLAMRYMHDYDVTSLALGTVDEKTVKDERAVFQPTTHIFVSQKVAWYDTEKDGLPNHQRFGGTFEEDMKAWEGKEE